MEGRQWCTIEQVAADIARAGDSTGGVRGAPLLDERCLVYGECAPPAMIIDHEEEERERYSRGGQRASSPGLRAPSPDLRGIQKMLRMVKGYCKSDDDESRELADHVVVIERNPCRSATAPTSNLRTDAPEFVPRINAPVFVPRLNGPKLVTRINGVSPTVVNSDVKHAAGEGTREEAIRVGAGGGGGGGDKADRIELDAETKRVGASRDQMELYESDAARQRRERAELAAMLQHQICAVAVEPPSIHRDRRRNAAIANLLRLYTATPSPHLRTPSYYETVTPTPAAPPEHCCVSPNLVRNTEKDEIETAHEPAPPTVDDPEMAASIDKVQDWLENKPAARAVPVPRTSPSAPHLAPFTYKRKERTPAAAVAAAASVSPAAADSTYVPSAYAAQLGAQYKQRQAARDSSADTLWDRLERQMRARDLEIRSRAATSPSACPSPSSLNPPDS